MGEEGIKRLDLQNGALSHPHIFFYGRNATTHLVYMLLRNSKDGKIGEFQDVDFDFPWKTVNVKQYEFVVANKFIELLQHEYGLMYEYTQVNKYCVHVKKNGDVFNKNLALKVSRNILTGNINNCQIVTIECTEQGKRDDEYGPKEREEGQQKEEAPLPVGDNAAEVDLSHVKIEKKGDKEKHSKFSSAVINKPVMQEEWAMIQNMRKHGKINMCICM